MENYLKNILKLFRHLTRSNQWLVIKTISLSVVVTALEMLMLILLGAIIESLLNHGNKGAAKFQFFTEFITDSSLISPEAAVPLLFAIVIILVTLTRLHLTKIQAKVSQDIGHTISSKIFDSYLNLDYDKIIRINTSEIIANITNKSMQVVRYSIHPLLQSITSFIMLLGFFSSFIIMGYAPYTSIILLAALLYYAIIIYARRRLTKSAKIIAEEHSKIVSNINATFGGMRNTVLENLGEAKSSQFSRHDKKLRGAEADSLFLSIAPKHIIEGTIMLAIAAAIIYVQMMNNNYFGLYDNIAAFGIIIIIFQKSLPLMQSIFYASTNARVGKVVLEEILTQLTNYHKTKKTDKPVLLHEDSELHLETELELINVTYRYPLSSQFILRNVNMRINSGDRVAIFGQTGSGKSTLLDILAALLVPSSGQLVCDGLTVDSSNNIKWRSRIGYLSQAPFFEDGTVQSSLVLDTSSTKRIDREALTNSLVKAGLASDESEARTMLDVKVGERGSLLSGGQRQKLALARILLTERKLILLDEATAALDTGSEREVVELIRNLQRIYTIIMVTHRPQPLSLCTRFFHVNNSSVTEVDAHRANSYFNGIFTEDKSSI